MKLLLISRDFPNIIGGVSDYTYHLSKALAEKGHNVYVLTSFNDKIIRNIEGNVKVLPLVKSWNFRGLPQIIKEIKKVNPDWVLLQYVPHMYSHYAIPVYIAMLSVILRFSGHKLLTTFHEVAIRFDLKKPKYWVIALIERAITYILCACSQKIVVSIDYYCKMLKRFNSKICRIPVGSSIIPYEVGAETLKRIKEQVAPNGEIIVSTFGSGASWIRNDVLLEAVNKLIKEQGILLKIIFLGGIGDSYQKNIIESLAKRLNIEKNIFITGYLQSNEIYKYLAVSDFFVLLDNNAYGGISTKSTSLASAYAAKLPIIGNRGILTDDFFKDKENILLINSVDSREVEKGILELFKNYDLCNKLKRGSEETYKDYLSWGRISESYTAIISSFV